MEYIVRILSTQQVTHNVKSFIFEKPEGFVFTPGQATDVSINKPEWKDKTNPFTFTCLKDKAYLEFTIKIYKEHNGVTNELNTLVPGDELIIRDAWGAINYKGEGYFLAGGAGITPFIAILRQLHADNAVKNNQLFFSNKSVEDIILHAELNEILGANAHYIISDKDQSGYYHGHIDKKFLQENITDFSKPFYICGPDKMVSDLTTILAELGAKPDSVVFEK